MVQWLTLCAISAVCPGFIPGWRTEVTQAALHGKKKKSRMCIWMAESLHYSPETTTPLLITIPQYKMKSLKLNKEKGKNGSAI